jgi:hypothetical protein
VIGRPDQRDLLGFDEGQAMPAREIVERTRSEVGRQSDHDLARHIAPLAGRRHAAAVARGGVLQRPGRGAERSDRIPGWTERRVRRLRGRTGDRAGQRIGGGVEWRRAHSRRNGTRRSLGRADHLARRSPARERDSERGRRHPAEVGHAEARSSGRAEAQSAEVGPAKAGPTQTQPSDARPADTGTSDSRRCSADRGAHPSNRAADTRNADATKLGASSG